MTHSRDRDRAGEIIDRPDAYVAALERRGVVAEPLENDLADLEACLARLDAIVVSGGLDVAPERYGGRRDETVDPPNRERDAFEIALVREARSRGIPFLGICRGLQIANVAFGGTLIEDVPGHRGRFPDGTARTGYLDGHEVTLVPGAFRDVAGAPRFLTNSLHHQAVRAIAGDLQIAGRAPDGIVEAVEPRFAHPFFFAVQWHPELLPASDAVAERLFGGLLEAASARRRSS